MKIRYGHVSNSSTSSFFGIGINQESIIRIKKEFLPTTEDDKYNEFIDKDGLINFDSSEFWEWLTYYWESSENNSKASVILHEEGVEMCWPYDDVYLVTSYTEMKLDETKQEFIDRVKKALNTVFDIEESAVGHVDYAWRDD